MEHDLGAADVDPVADVALDQRRLRVHVAAAEGGEVVDDQHVVPAGDEGVDEVRADEAGSSGDGGAHTPYRRHPVFITFEGQDGAGKTTQAGLLVEWLRAGGREVDLDA